MEQGEKGEHVFIPTSKVELYKHVVSEGSTTPERRSQFALVDTLPAGSLVGSELLLHDSNGHYKFRAVLRPGLLGGAKAELTRSQQLGAERGAPVFKVLRCRKADVMSVFGPELFGGFQAWLGEGLYRLRLRQEQRQGEQERLATQPHDVLRSSHSRRHERAHSNLRESLRATQNLFNTSSIENNLREMTHYPMQIRSKSFYYQKAPNLVMGSPEKQNLSFEAICKPRPSIRSLLQKQRATLKSHSPHLQQAEAPPPAPVNFQNSAIKESMRFFIKKSLQRQSLNIKNNERKLQFMNQKFN